MDQLANQKKALKAVITIQKSWEDIDQMLGKLYRSEVITKEELERHSSSSNISLSILRSVAGGDAIVTAKDLNNTISTAKTNRQEALYFAADFMFGGRKR